MQQHIEFTIAQLMSALRSTFLNSLHFVKFRAIIPRSLGRVHFATEQPLVEQLKQGMHEEAAVREDCAR